MNRCSRYPNKWQPWMGVTTFTVGRPDPDPDLPSSCESQSSWEDIPLTDVAFGFIASNGHGGVGFYDTYTTPAPDTGGANMRYFFDDGNGAIVFFGAPNPNWQQPTGDTDTFDLIITPAAGGTPQVIPVYYAMYDDAIKAGSEYDSPNGPPLVLEEGVEYCAVFAYRKD